MKRLLTKNETLKAMIDGGVVKFLNEPVRLKSGRHTQFYVSGRSEVTENTELGVIIGYCIRKHVKQIVESEKDGRKICYIGIPTVGTGLASSVVMSHLMLGEENKACYAILREHQKLYGKDNGHVNGKPNHDYNQYFLIDNVLTTGESFIESARKLRQDEFTVQQIHGIAFVDRSMDEEVMTNTCKQAGLKSISSVFTLAEIVQVATNEKWWPEEAGSVYIKEKANWYRSGGGEGM